MTARVELPDADDARDAVIVVELPRAQVEALARFSHGTTHQVQREMAQAIADAAWQALHG